MYDSINNLLILTISFIPSTATTSNSSKLTSNYSVTSDDIIWLKMDYPLFKPNTTITNYSNYSKQMDISQPPAIDAMPSNPNSLLPGLPLLNLWFNSIAVSF